MTAATAAATATFEATVADLKVAVETLVIKFYSRDMPAGLQRAFDHACIVIDEAEAYRAHGVSEQDEYGLRP